MQATHKSFLSLLLSPLLNLVLPPTCLVCRAMVSDAGTLCGPCWSKVKFISQPYCLRCALPLPFAGTDNICAQCTAVPPPFAAAASVMVYDDMTAPLVAAFKYADRLDAAPALAALLLRAAAPLVARCDIMTAVPLNRRRLWQRRYNQSAVLAQHLARASGKNYQPQLLLQKAGAAKQTTLAKAQRLRNAQHIYSVAKTAPAIIAGKSVLLIDDVFTTGATLSACANLLLQAGAAEVLVASLARTPLTEGG